QEHRQAKGQFSVQDPTIRRDGASQASVTVDAQFAARRHAWGLSQGLMMLSPAGGFWLLFAIFRGTSAASEGPVAIVPIVALACVPTIVLFAKSLTLRRLADFNATIL